MPDYVSAFVDKCTSPEWIIFAVFISGFAGGWMVSAITGAGDYIVQLVNRFAFRKDKKREDSDAS